MVLFSRWAVTVSILMLALTLGACGKSTKRVYEESTYGPPLEVPPDLTVPGSDETLEIPNAARTASAPTSAPRAEDAKPAILPDQENIVLMRDGAQRWLVINGEPNQVWPWVRSFWLKRGIDVKFEDPTTAILETDWVQQQALLPDAEQAKKDAKKDDAKVFGVPTREKFRVRLERGDKPGTTEIYLTHRGVELSEQDGMLAWHLRGSDRELEAQALRQLMVFLGTEQNKAGGVLAKPKEIERRATLNADAQGVAILHMEEEFANAWRRVELALDRLGYQIEDRDRSRGVFYVLAKDALEDLNGEKKRSWWSRVFSREESGQKQYQVVLKDEGETANLYVRNKSGDKIENSLAEPVLKRLQEHLK